ncbi:MAG: hypothetical protein HY906_24175 [Deltaproteobacteria bacterium]|nr:hypothetical protein [Deltaproteobacteria bacterium]
MCVALVVGCKQGLEPGGQDDAGASHFRDDGGPASQDAPVNTQQDGPQNPAQHDGAVTQHDGAVTQQDGPAVQHDGSTTTAKLPGSACQCDGECQAVGTHVGICVFGVCMTRASAACSAAGSTAECGAGSRCWGLQGQTGSICWPDCATYTACAGTCDGDGSCVSTSAMDCDHTCGAYCSQPVNPGTGPGPVPTTPPACLSSLPPRDCTGTSAYCSQLITFDPRTNTSWDDYAINGETSSNQYRSYLRRDLVMLIQYATAKVACLASGWTTGTGGALGLGDMSESNGAIPGTSVGSPGHPAGTHTNGVDIDVGYYQKNTSDNRLREICTHTTSGVEQYHCTAAPTTLDQWRHALFLGVLTEHARLRVVGVDGKAGPIIEAAITQLCTDGWMSGASCNDVPLAYEVTDTGMGWFLFHHHHSHVSLTPTSGKMARPSRCLDAACAIGSRKALPLPPYSVD